jgi:hypothetical protein
VNPSEISWREQQSGRVQCGNCYEEPTVALRQISHYLASLDAILREGVHRQEHLDKS